MSKKDDKLKIEEMEFYDKLIYLKSVMDKCGNDLEKIHKQLKIKSIDFPNTMLPNKFPDNLRKVFNGRVEFIKSLRDPIQSRFPHDAYAQMVRELRISLSAFQNEMTLKVWIKINKISSETSESFISELTHSIPNSYVGISSLIEKHNAEIRCGKYMLERAKELKNIMENYANMFFGHFIEESFVTTLESLEKFIIDTEQSIKEFGKSRRNQSNYFSDLWPISREYKSRSGQAIFFTRRIYLFFQERFKKPMHNENAVLVNAMFHTTYTENDIIKMVKTVRKLKKCEN